MDEMSEEKPVFKVRDRRLFNPDGTPREVEGREEPQTATSDTVANAPTTQTDAGAHQQPAAATTSTDANANATAATTASQSAPAVESDAQAAQASSAAASSSARQPQNFEAESDEQEIEDVPGADDPASFINFLMSIASNAAAALGMMEHPATGQRGVDLPLGKHWIDVLGMLHQKTRGNLAPQEQQILEGILADLRMQYVSLTSTTQSRASGPRGFSGRDIIGGK
jgi:hypothetical protein